MANVSLNNVGKSYGKTAVLSDINVEINEGDFVVLVGPSGCGKSTLLRMLAGLEEITEGDLLMEGEKVNDCSPAERGIAMVFQSYALYPHMNVYKNMAFGLKIANVEKTAMEKRIIHAAKILEIDHLLDRLPRELSGGQRQRVAIGRAIVRQPKLFLFDEPLSNLDASLRVQTRLEIAKLHQQLKATIVYVTHDQVEAMTLGSKIVVLSGGSVQQAGSPLELYQKPANEFVATFIGSPAMNTFNGRIKDIQATQCLVTLDNGSDIWAKVDATRSSVGDVVTVGGRSEHFSETDTLSEKLHGKVSLVEHLGEANFIYLTLANGQDMVVRGNGNHAVDIGQEMTVSMNPSDFYMFDHNGVAYERLEPGNMVVTGRPVS